VIADQHQRAGRPRRVDPAGGVGDDQDAGAERDQHAGRERHGLGAVALVHVDAALHRDAACAGALADHQPAGVPGDVRPRDVRDVGVVDRRGTGEPVGEPAEPRAEDQPDLGRAVGRDRARARTAGLRPGLREYSSGSVIAGSPGYATRAARGGGPEGASIVNAFSMSARASASRPSPGRRSWHRITWAGRRARSARRRRRRITRPAAGRSAIVGGAPAGAEHHRRDAERLAGRSPRSARRQVSSSRDIARRQHGRRASRTPAIARPGPRPAGGTPRSALPSARARSIRARPFRGVARDPAEHQHLGAEHVGQTRGCRSGRRRAGSRSTRGSPARCRSSGRSARSCRSARRSPACRRAGRFSRSSAHSSRARSIVFMNAPRPTLQSITRPSMPSASFFDMIDDAIIGSDSTVAVHVAQRVQPAVGRGDPLGLADSGTRRSRRPVR